MVLDATIGRNADAGCFGELPLRPALVHEAAALVVLVRGVKQQCRVCDGLVYPSQRLTPASGQRYVVTEQRGRSILLGHRPLPARPAERHTP